MACPESPGSALGERAASNLRFRKTAALPDAQAKKFDLREFARVEKRTFPRTALLT